MMDYSKELEELFEGPDGYLFKPKEKRKVNTAEDRLAEGFNKIVAFVERSRRIPDQNAEDIAEMALGVSLANIKSDKDKVEKLREIDELGLLEIEKAPESLEKLFEIDGDLFDQNELFNINALPNHGQPRNTGDVAKRKSISNSDFHHFRKIFEAKQDGLKNGKYRLVKFRTVTEIKLHGFYIVDGIMCYVEQIGKQKEVFGRQKERIRVIFENGTESNMYLRTLSSELYRAGYIVVDNMKEKEDAEDAVGYIYILKSLSDDPVITTIKNLYKIGVTTGSVEDRIKNAETDPTYLMAPVEIVASYQLTGEYQPIKVESLIHRFFADAKVDMQIIDNFGLEYTPDEWYSVPTEAIEEAVDRIIDKSLTKYYYDVVTQKIGEIK